MSTTVWRLTVGLVDPCIIPENTKGQNIFLRGRSYLLTTIFYLNKFVNVKKIIISN
jgi:hypothetical protein